MGQDASCLCIANSLGMEDKEYRERIDTLKRGQKFMRSTFLGMAQREVFVNLSEDMSKLMWKASKTTLAAEETGEIDFTKIKNVKMAGSSTLQFIGENDKSVFDVNCEDTKIRDLWVIALNEILQDWILHPDNKPKSNLTAAGTTNKLEYFAKRQEEIKAREAQAKETKQKYLSGGMKYTAIAMANRS